MATNKIYMESNSTTGLAVVTEIIEGERPIVRLNRTLFHPRGGGQPADEGRLVVDVGCDSAAYAGEAYVYNVQRETARVLDVRHAEHDEIDHHVSSLAGLQRGATVLMAVDREVRRRHARLHTAGHVLADVAVRLAPHLQPRQAHHWPGEARVEFEGALSEPDTFALQLNARLAEAVAANLPVRVLGGHGGPRSVQVGDGASVGCGGTHIASTAELAGLSIRRVQAKKGVVRIGYDLI